MRSFDSIDHHALMVRVRRRVSDRKVNRLLVAFLKAGVLSEEQFLRSDVGTPQGGILSPLLSNIALSAIEERYERQTWPRHEPRLLTDPRRVQKRVQDTRRTDRERGRPVLVPVRYADDFIVLVGLHQRPDDDTPAEEKALSEKAALATYLRDQLGLELSEAKTLVTPVTRPMRFLGHHVRVRPHPGHHRMVSTAVIPKERSHRLRERIKALFRRTTARERLENRLHMLNPLLRGWSNFYCHAWGAKNVFNGLDHYVWWTIFRWLRKKHHRASVTRLKQLYGWRKPKGRCLRWRDGHTTPFEMSLVRVEPYRLAWEKTPNFALDIYGEPGA